MTDLSYMLPKREELDNHDERIPYYHLELERDLPAPFTESKGNAHEAAEIVSETMTGPFPVNLPAGYHFEFYQPGDKAAWINIEISNKEVKDAAAGERAWERYFADHEKEMPERMVFLVNETGEKVGTATAFYDSFGTDDGVLGWLHWVGIHRKEQGRGLAKPLIAFTLNRLVELDYSRCHIPTQTTTWLAVRIYLDFGFLPTEKSLREAPEGWKIIKEITHHPALAGIVD